MDLKDFVKDTITSIAEAVVEVQAELAQKGVVVNPPRSSRGEQFYETETAFNYRRVELVGFDVAVAARDENSVKAGGGLKIAVLNVGFAAGGEVGEKSGAERVSRITFSIAVSLPVPSEATQRLARVSSPEAESSSEGSWKTV